MFFSEISTMVARIVIASTVAFGVLSTARADVWETKAQWNERYEQEFSEWIRTLPLNYFSNPNSKYGTIATDCADAAYVARAIFAFERGLPVEFSGHPELKNSSKMFDGEEDEIKRLRKFFVLIRNETTTRTLVRDTYPIAINRRTLRPGVLYLNPIPSQAEIREHKIPAADRSGHVYYIQSIFQNGMIQYVSSTVPALVRDLQPRIGITFAPFATTGGYRAFKWPGVPEEQQPGYSMEQFRIANWYPNNFEDKDYLWERWQASIRTRIAERASTPLEEFKAKLFNVKGYIKERTNLVNKSWQIYQTKYNGMGCTSKTDYDAYSTPSRDVKIQNELYDLKQAAKKYLQTQGDYDEQSVQRLFASYRFEVMSGVQADLNDLWRAFHTEVVLVISEPEHSPAVRWGVRPQGSWPCPERRKNYKNIELAR